jgi:hypothetical protein
MDILGRARRFEKELGLDAKTALKYADFIGDTPEVDADGKVVIRDQKNKVIARLSIEV